MALVEILRVPLHADEESAATILQRFDHAIGRDGADRERAGHGLHRLVVRAVYPHGAPPEHVVKPRARLHRHRVMHFGRRPRHPVRQRARHLSVDVLHQGAAQGDVHELHAAADPQHREVPPAGLRDQGDLRIGALWAHDLEGKAFALAIAAGIDVGPATGQHQSVQAVQNGAAEGPFGDDRKDDRDAASRFDGRHVAVPDEDRGLALAPALAGPRVEIRRDPDDRLPHGAGDGSPSSLAPVAGSLRRHTCEAEFFLPAQMVRRHDVVALDCRVPDRIRGSLVEARQDIREPADDSPQNRYRDLDGAVRDRADEAGHAESEVGGRIGITVLFSRPFDRGQTDRQGHDHRHHLQRDALHVMPPEVIVLCTQPPFSSLYTIFTADARQPHFMPSASTASLGIRSLPFHSYCSSARKTSALTARRMAGETLASARRRDGPLFIESQNSSGLLKTHPTVMRSVRTWRKPAARSARSMAPALPKRKKSGAPGGGWNASCRSRARRTIPSVLTLLSALQMATATRPPGTSTRCISPRARSASGISMSPNRQTTRSKVRLSKVRRSASISWNCAFRTPRARARARAPRSMVGEKSTPATKPRGPTRRAMVRAGSPGPVATSSTHMPGRIAASSISRRPNGRNSGRTTSV